MSIAALSEFRMADALGVGVAAVDATGTQTYVNEAFATMVGWSAAELRGAVAPFRYWPEEHVARIEDAFARTLSNDVPSAGFELVFKRSDDKRVDVLVKVTPFKASDESAPGWVACVTDISAIKRASRRQRFLLEAGRLLASSLEYEATLWTVAKMAVPALADYCLIDLVEASGELRRVGIADVDKSRETRLWEHWRRWPVHADDEIGIAEIVRSGKPMLVPHVQDTQLTNYAMSEEQLASLRSMNMRSSMIVPMVARDRVLGVITLNSCDSDRHYDEADLEVALVLAERAALAVDNATLYAASESLASENARLFEHASAANIAKTEFLATMSHELRTPLNAMIGYADLMLMGVPGSVTAQQRLYLERMKSSAFHQVRLVDEILGFSRMEAGKEEVDLGVADVCEIVRDVGELIRPLAEQKNLTLRVETGDVSLEMRTDANKVRQVVLNLAANAVKFTERGMVTLVVRRSNDEALLSVQDTGRGIDIAKHDLVFEPFVQLDQTNTRSAGGTGLGLAISKKLVEMLGGEITIQSEPGQGSTFTVVLPLAPRPQTHNDGTQA